MNKTRIGAALLLLATILFALVPIARGKAEMPTTHHHLLHAAMLAGAALSGIFFANLPLVSRTRREIWLVAAMIAPVLAMLLMWPSEYSYFDSHPYGHTLEHLGLVLLGFVTGYGGQQYARGIGWAAGASAVAMAFFSAWGYGVGPAIPSLAAAPAATKAAMQIGRLPNAHGAALFAQNCAVCHGPGGTGGEGPRLKNERARKTLAQTIAWIENPAPPMPKLYPSPLSPQDVAAVASYVQALK